MENLKLIVEKFSENNYEINQETYSYYQEIVSKLCKDSCDNFFLELSNKAAEYHNEKARIWLMQNPTTNANIPNYSGEGFFKQLEHTNYFEFFSLIKCFEYTGTKHKEALIKIEKLEQEVKNNSFIINEHVFDIRDLYGKNRELSIEVKKINKYVNGYIEETCSLKNELNSKLIFLETEIIKQQKIIYLIIFVFFILLSVLFLWIQQKFPN